MITKVYEKIKEILKNNFRFLILLIVLFGLVTFELPYYIDAPGGLIDVSERIDIENSYSVEGSFNLAYVSEMKATIPTLLFSLFQKDWDVLKKEEVVASNETIEEMDYRNNILLQEANQNAVYIGFQKASKYVSITNQKVYVVYIDEQAQTDLSIGDQILEINHLPIHSKQDVYDILKDCQVGETVSITVETKSGNITKTAKMIKEGNRAIIGIVTAELKDIDTNENVAFHFKPSESGPSGGFMMALSIYNYLTEDDLTHGLKIVGTGTIDELGNVGSIGGVEYKIKAAVKKKAKIFFCPEDNYEEAYQVIEDNHLDIQLVKVGHIDDAITYLQNL